MIEIWKPVLGYEGLYEVSSDGRIRSLYFAPPKLLKFGRDETGYPTIMLSKDGRRKPHTVHRLVALTFHGKKRNALHREVAHLDGDKTNPAAANLKWVSKIENESHKRLHGTRRFGSAVSNSLLTEAEVVEIIRLLAIERWSCRRAARKYGVSPGTVEAIRRGRNWRHIQRPPEFAERWDAGRNQSGTNSHNAKLSWADVLEVRARWNAGEGCRSIAVSFGIGHSAAYKAAVGQTYSARKGGRAARQGIAQTIPPSRSRGSDDERELRFPTRNETDRAMRYWR